MKINIKLSAAEVKQVILDKISDDSYTEFKLKDIQILKDGSAVINTIDTNTITVEKEEPKIKKIKIKSISSKWEPDNEEED